MTGTEFEKIAKKYGETKPAFLNVDGNYYTTFFDWDAIAAEISKSLTMEELVYALDESSTEGDLIIIANPIYDCKVAQTTVNLDKFLDLINKGRER